MSIDDHPAAALADLTTVRQPVVEQGRQAAQLLTALLRGRSDVTRSVTVPTELVVRLTTAPPPGTERAG